MEPPKLQPQSISEKRREARRLRDPHHAQPFKRYFLGPTPVPSSSAASTAQAIAEDVKVLKPIAIGVLDQGGNLITGRRPSQGSVMNEELTRAATTIPLDSTPTKARRKLSPLRIPRGNMLSPFSADRDRSSLRRHVSRDASFTSAKSMPDSVIGEAEDLPIHGPPNDQKIQDKKSLKSDASAMVDFSYHDAFSFATPPKKKRGESQSSIEPIRDLGRKKLSFEVMSPRDRRGRSEGSPAPGGSILQKGSSRSNTYDIDMPAARQLTEEPTSMNRTPTKDKQWHTLHPLRTMTSHRSIGQVSRSSIGSPSTPIAAGKTGPPTPNAKISDPPISIMTDADTSLGFDTGPSARLQRLRDRARKRYGQANIEQGQMPPRTLTQQSHLSHGRDISRQSRMSRASTVGTFASIATRFTEGSFGATGGVRSKVVKKLGGKNSKSILARARDIKVEHLRHGHTMSSKGGVLPGTVGTSAGGTKWVGQTFEVGKRFWQVLESREEQLRDETIDEEALEEEKLDIADKRALEAASIRRAVEVQHARQVALSRSPEAVIDSFAREAKDATDEHRDEFKNNKGQTLELQDAQIPAMDRRIEGDPGQADVSAQEVKPKASSSHKRQLSKAEIENRQGWNDVVSFMSAKQSFKSREKGGKHGKKESLSNDLQAQKMDDNTFQQEKRADMKIEASAIGTTQLEMKANKRTTMTFQEALAHPTPPKGVEEKFPEAVHELLRRQSNPGIRPSGERDDAASDHQVAAGLLSTSPLLLTPTDISSPYKWNEMPSSELTRLRSNSTSSLERKPLAAPPTSSTPLLKKRASAIGIVTSSTKESQAVAWNNNKPSILRDAGFDTTLQKKSVQFHGSNSLVPPLNRFSPSFLRNSPTKEMDGKMVLGGRARSVIMGDAAPAPPEEVLSRNVTPDLLSPPLDHSLVSSPAADTRPEDLITIRSVLRRDRMLVRLAWSPSENLPKDFSERDSRKYPMYSEPFKEYMVVYRLGRLELWEDTSVMSKCIGHGDQLKLSVAVSLKRGKTFVSTYSYIDRIFCLTFTKDDETHHRLPHLRRSGTRIWFFDSRSITVGADWMWDLWRDLGGTIPQVLDVHIPAFSVRVRMPIPDEITPKDTASMDSKSVAYFEGGEGFKIITPGYVKKVVRKVVEVQPEWRQLCHGVEKSGMQFELAWRSGPTLNWIKEAKTADGQRRDWAVLVGSIISEPQRPSMLEYRPAFHYPTQVRTAKGETLMEPPGIEGFLWRVKAVSGALTRLYTSTHDGLIFVNRSSKAFPPDRHLASLAYDTGHMINDQSKYTTGVGFDDIGQDRRRKRDTVRGRNKTPYREESLAELRSEVMATLVQPPTTEEEMDAQIETHKSFEKRRQFEQISNCDGYVDMRDIVLVRSLEDVEPSHAEVKHQGERSNGHAQTNTSDSIESIKKVEEEEEDLGGEEGLALAKDRVGMKRSRQFEVILSNGRSIRFEAYSNSVAKEWIDRMTELSVYWKRREKVDAMELMTASGISRDLVGKKKTQNEREHRAMDHSTEGERLSAVLGNLWHWCLHHSCRGILRSGRLFEKKKAFSGFYSRYYILIAGRLIHFKLMTSTSTARARQNQGIFHKRQETIVHLRDAYIYSGQLSEDMLVNGRSEGAGSINTFGSGSGGSANANTRHTLPRVYGDGLMSFDDDEDCTFVLRYRPQRLNQAADPAVRVGLNDFSRPDQTIPASTSSIPKLGDATYNTLVLRARSKLERDLWVRAINVECERLNRLDREREEKIRNQGETPWKSSWHH